MIKYATKSTTSVTDIFKVYGLFKLSRDVAISLVPGSIAAPVTIDVSRPTNNMIPVAIITIVFAKVLKDVLTPALVGVFRIGSSITTKLTVNTYDRTIKASGTVRVNRVRNTVDNLTVKVYKVVAILFSVLVV